MSDDGLSPGSRVDRLLERRKESQTLAWAYLVVFLLLGGLCFWNAIAQHNAHADGLLALAAAIMFANYSMSGHGDQVAATIADDARSRVRALEDRIAALDARLAALDKVSKLEERVGALEAAAKPAQPAGYPKGAMK